MALVSLDSMILSLGVVWVREETMVHWLDYKSVLLNSLATKLVVRGSLVMSDSLKRKLVMLGSLV